MIKVESIHFKAVCLWPVWLPLYVRADSSRLRFPAHDLHAILRLPSTLQFVRMSNLRTCCRQLHLRPVRRPSRLIVPRSQYMFAFLCKFRLSLVLDR